MEMTLAIPAFACVFVLFLSRFHFLQIRLEIPNGTNYKKYGHDFVGGITLCESGTALKIFASGR
jgi:hypothetical protein